MYEAVLQPLQVSASQGEGIDPTRFVDLDDDEDTPLQQGAVNLCE